MQHSCREEHYWRQGRLEKFAYGTRRASTETWPANSGCGQGRKSSTRGRDTAEEARPIMSRNGPKDEEANGATLRLQPKTSSCKMAWRAKAGDNRHEASSTLCAVRGAIQAHVQV